MKAFIESQFNYCPITWMFHSRQLNDKRKKFHERALRLVYKNQNLSFHNSFYIHHRNLQKLTIEIYKAKNKICSTLFKEIFQTRGNTYKLRNNRFWQTINVRTEGFGTETLLFRGQKTCQLLPNTVKQIRNL